MADIALLKRLCEANGVSGSEEEVRAIILGEVKGCAESIEVDALGNVIVFKQGRRTPRTRLMLSAHMDEVGLIVTHIMADGLLKFAEVGGIDRRVLCGTPVLVNGEIPGVVGAKPIHLMKSDEREKSVPVEDLYIDIGATDKEEAESFVLPGDIVTFDSFFDTSHGKIKSRALDDRAGCVIMIDMIKGELPYDMTFAFVVQEEIGLRGAKTAAYQISPQAAIVVETTTAADVADVDENKRVCRVGKGPVLSFMDRHTVYDKEYYKLAMELAQNNNIPCQPKEAVAGGNDAGAIHSAGSGARTVAVSVACRYLHAPMGLISQEDFHNAEKLVMKLAEEIASRPPTR